MSRGKSKQELARELGDEFRINQNLNEVFDDAARQRLGVNATDLRCLDIIQRLDGVTAGELAREAGLTTGAVTSVIDRLERAGYVKREADPNDRRKVLVKMTPAAFEAVYSIWGPETQDYMEQMSRLPREHLEAFLAFMRQGNEIQRKHLDRIRGETG
jgi:DNA-binding MarR family transcriptional regulator